MTDPSASERLSPEARLAIDQHLYKRTAAVGIACALISGLLVWCIQESSGAAAREAVATGLQSMMQGMSEAKVNVALLQRDCQDSTTQIVGLKDGALKASEEARAALAMAADATKRVASMEGDIARSMARVGGYEANSKEVHDRLEALRASFDSALGAAGHDETLRLLRQVMEDHAGATPVGAVIAWPSEVLPTANGVWRVCDGSSLAAEDYPALHAVLGSRYGPSDPGSFRLPDYRGLILMGADGGARIGDKWSWPVLYGDRVGEAAGASAVDDIWEVTNRPRNQRVLWIMRLR